MKRIVCILNVLFIYCVMFLPIFIFYGNKVSAFEIIWTNLFNNNAFGPIILLLVLCLITFITNVVFYAKSIKDDVDIKYLVKSNLIVKIIQIPAYIMIFVISIICFITIFTFAISIVLAVLDFVSLVMTGIYAVTCYRKLKENKVITNNEFVVFSILSFVFCADLVVAIISYKKCKHLEKGEKVFN